MLNSKIIRLVPFVFEVRLWGFGVPAAQMTLPRRSLPQQGGGEELAVRHIDQGPISAVPLGASLCFTARLG